MIFSYKDKNSLPWRYYGVMPTGFFECPGSPSCKSGTFMSAWDPTVERYKEYCVDTITDVVGDISLIDALLNPSESLEFWNGDLSRTGKLPLYEDLLSEIEKATDVETQNKLVSEWLKENISAETTLVGNPASGIEHDAYTVVIDGVPVYIDEINDAAVALARELLTGAELPDVLKPLLVGIQIVPEQARIFENTIAQNSEGFVTIFGDRIVDIGVIAHELGHEYSLYQWQQLIPPEGSDYLAAVESGEPPVSEYASGYIAEDFPEALALYVTDPEKLKAIAPLRYEAIKKLMEV